MRGQRLLVLPIAQSRALIIERSQGAVENLESGEILLLRLRFQKEKEREQSKAEIRPGMKSTHPSGFLMLSPNSSFRDEINGEAAKPMPAFIMRSSHRPQPGAPMRFGG